MADQVQAIAENKEENKNPAEQPLIQEVREKSFHQILQEQAEQRANSATKPLDQTPNKSDTAEEEEKKRLDQEAREAKEKVEAEEAAKKHDTEIATKAAEETIARQKKAEQDAQLTKQKEEEAKKHEEELKPRYTGRDKDGNVVPLSYEEIAQEGARIGKLQALEEVRLERERQIQEQENQKTLQQQTEAQRKEQEDNFKKQLQGELEADEKAIYAAGDLPKIVNKDDPKDSGVLAYNHLYETAQKVNAVRLAAGKPVIRSLQMIRYGRDEEGKPYYTPLQTKVAGHDAPVFGGESTITKEAPEDKYIPARDRNKSMKQLLKEEAARINKRLNVRGT